MRANLMWCAALSLDGFTGVGVSHDWAANMIGHELAGLAGLGHTKTRAVLLPGN